MRRNIQTISDNGPGGMWQGYADEMRRSDLLMGLQPLSDITPSTIGNLGEAILAAMKKETTP
jgi:hypothetical protein